MLPATTNKRAAVSTALLFGTNGALFGAIVPRLPELKAGLELSEGQFGAAMAAFPLGALLAAALTPILLRHISDGRLAGWAMIAAAALTLAVPAAPGGLAFAGALALFGAADAVTDIAMNAQGIRLQQRVRRSIINRFHAVWSAGAVAGGLVGSASAGLGVGLIAQFLGVAVLCAGLSFVALRWRLADTRGETGEEAGPESGDEPRERPSAGAGSVVSARIAPRTWLRLLALGLLAASAVLVEDFAQTWAALYLLEVAAVPVALAGAGFVAVQGAQFVGRLTGDTLVDRFGATAVARSGGLCVVAGVVILVVAAATTSGGWFLVAAVPAFALAGWGVATVIPGAMLAADVAGGLPAGVGLSVLNWALRLGFITAPPLVGLIAETVGLYWGVVPMIVGGVVIVCAAGLLGPRDKENSP